MVSVRATTGILRRLASLTSSSSRLGSMTKTAPGSRSISVIPAKLRRSFWYSRFSANHSLPVRSSSGVSSTLRARSLKYWMRGRIVWKLVRMPPM